MEVRELSTANYGPEVGRVVAAARQGARLGHHKVPGAVARRVAERRWALQTRNTRRAPTVTPYGARQKNFIVSARGIHLISKFGREIGLKSSIHFLFQDF
jgi:hypothetical protein